jgi:anti-sigma B factor antagonist
MVDHLLRINSQRIGEALVVAVTGEIDTFTAPKLDTAIKAVIEQMRGPIVIDLSNVTFLGSRGLAVLATATADARHRRRQLHIVVGQASSVLRPLQVLGLDGMLPLCATLDEALVAQA